MTNKIKEHIQTYAHNGEFSGSILEAKKGDVLFKGAFGFADNAKKIPNKIDTKYLIASTTKSFRAIGHYVGELSKVEDNNLSYALGSGSMYSTIEDIYKWDQALYNDDYLSMQSKELNKIQLQFQLQIQFYTSFGGIAK